MAPTLLLTRPLTDSRRFAAMLPDLSVVISPVIEIVPVAHDTALLARAEGLVFTSANAVAAAGPGAGRPAYCVGGRTAEMARKAGFDVIEGGGDAVSLAPLVAKAKVPLVHPHGRHLAADLGVPGVVVYDQQARPLSDAAQALLADTDPVIVALFSPRSARLLGDQMPDATASLWVAAISAAAMTAWPRPAACRETAHSPDATGMRDAIIRLLLREQS